ncbi:MAG: tRNA pseudouridine(38-40) synthase TruA [Promethearchaeota archaeon]
MVQNIGKFKYNFKGFFYIKVFYLGENYQGLAKQPNADTIEERLLRALIATNYIPKLNLVSPQDPKYPYLFYAGRTDRGVNALGMVFGFFSLKDKVYPIEINGKLPNDIIVWASAKVHETIENQELHLKNPRYYAIKRIYRYFLYNPSNNIEMKNILAITSKFIGKKDFSNFSKKDVNQKTVRTIDEINVFYKKNLIIFEFKAKSFLWNQIRKIMCCIIKILKGEWKLEYIDQLFDLYNPNNHKLVSQLGLAPPFQLFLWNVEYPNDIKFELCHKSISKLKSMLDNYLKSIQIKFNILSFIKNNF